MAHIMPRKNKKGIITSYTIRVSRGYDSNGKRLKPYTMSYKPAPNMTVKQADKEAKRQALLFEEQCRLGYAPDSRQTFAQYAEYVLTVKEQAGTKHTTVTRYRELLERINAGIGHIKLADIRPQHLTELYFLLRQNGLRKNVKAIPATDLKQLLKSVGITQKKLAELSGISLTTINAVKCSKTVSVEKAEALCKALEMPVNRVFKVEQDNTPLSEKTIQEHHRLIHLILSYAEKEMIIPYNPAEKVINKPKSDRKHQVNYFEPETLDRIRECLDSAPLKWKVITHLLLVTGCRRGEIMGLKWSAVDFENNQIKINNNFLYSKDFGVYQDSTKTDTSDRIIRLTDETMELLKDYRIWWEKFRHDSGTEWNCFIDIPDGKGIKHTERAEFLFVKDSGNNIGYPMNPDSITSWLNKFSKNNNLPHINPHAFRHTLASVLCLNGIDITTISKWLGHKNVTTTMNIYEHILEQGREQVVNCVEDIILKNKKTVS
ncbi:MAG: tyrosine-type recombinase/integrase [Ruminococcus sp.]|nr:tyrosine-type recombinase/integrase [Ruminococcus sp.]